MNNFVKTTRHVQPVPDLFFNEAFEHRLVLGWRGKGIQLTCKSTLLRHGAQFTQASGQSWPGVVDFPVIKYRVKKSLRLRLCGYSSSLQKVGTDRRASDKRRQLVRIN